MDKEYLFYTLFQKQATDLRSKLNLKPLAIPKCSFALLDPGVFVMTNLKDMGYEMLKNQIKDALFRGLQDSDLRLFLEALGSFHATMYRVLNENGGPETILEKYPTLGYRLREIISMLRISYF